MSDDREKRRYVASVAERIAWTAELAPREKHVLAMLSTFGNFVTGQNCRPHIETLAARAGMSRAAVYRALRQLEDDGWVTAVHRYRQNAVYTINVERLATHPSGAKVAVDIGAPKGEIEPVQNLRSETDPPLLSLTSETEPTQLSLTSETQEIGSAIFTTTYPVQNLRSETQISRTDLDLTKRDLKEELISRTKAPPLRVGPDDADKNQEAKDAKRNEFDSEVQSTVGSADLSTVGADRVRHVAAPAAAAGDALEHGAVDPAPAGTPGGDQASSSAPGVFVRERPDSPGAVGGGIPLDVAPDGPQQQSLPPMGVGTTAAPPVRDVNWPKRYLEIVRAALKRSG